MHKKEIENLEHDKNTLINESNTLKDTHEQEIKNLKY